jgi:hypothetical protein
MNSASEICSRLRLEASLAFEGSCSVTLVALGHTAELRICAAVRESPRLAACVLHRRDAIGRTFELTKIFFDIEYRHYCFVLKSRRFKKENTGWKSGVLPMIN